MSDQVSFEWDWQRAEYLAAERDSWARSAARPRAARTLFLLSAAAFALFAAVYASRGNLTFRNTLVLAVLAFGLPWLGARVGEWATPRIRARQFARRHLPAYGRTFAMVDLAGVTLKWRDNSVQLGWSTFIGFAETDEFILLYHSPKSSIYLPKRAMPAEQLDAARALVQRGMHGRRGEVPTTAA
jgi:hypothetical protein